MDGRAIQAVKEHLLENDTIQFADCITWPGLDGMLSGGTGHIFARKALSKILWFYFKRFTVRISVGHHGSRCVIVGGHGDCAGYPVSRAEHEEAVRSCCERVAGWDYKIDEPVTVLGVYTEEKDGVCSVDVIVRSTVEPRRQPAQSSETREQAA